jgi:hypothetical protein
VKLPYQAEYDSRYGADSDGLELASEGNRVQQGFSTFLEHYGKGTAGIRLRRIVDTTTQMDLDSTRSNPSQRQVMNELHGCTDSDGGHLADSAGTRKDSGCAESTRLGRTN